MSTIEERLRQVRDFFGGTQKSMSSRLGLSLNAWQDVERGKHRPSWPILEALAEQGIDTNWVLTGKGEMVAGVTAPISVEAAPSDPKFVGRVAEAISKVYEEVGVAVTIRQLMELSATRHDAIISMAADDEQKDQMLQMYLNKLRQDLNNGVLSSKRRA